MVMGASSNRRVTLSPQRWTRLWIQERQGREGNGSGMPSMPTSDGFDHQVSPPSKKCCF